MLVRYNVLQARTLRVVVCGKLRFLYYIQLEEEPEGVVEGG